MTPQKAHTSRTCPTFFESADTAQVDEGESSVEVDDENLNDDVLDFKFFLTFGTC